MKLSEAVVPISYAKSHTAQIIAGIVRGRKPVVITQNGHARAIIQDMQSYEQTQESLALLKILAQGQADIRAGRFKPLRKAFADARKRARDAEVA
ncbi:MAG: type II toxin-antitoxin system Phd/YefM family antitoxin [Lentisphaerae bacterium]|nr:type II toxin-antitoxin system Phd/YefM family antitoxin [Lentisphaerota bacterium]